MYGMLKTMGKLYLDKKTSNIQNPFGKSKARFEINEETYDKNQMKFKINHEGNKTIKKCVFLSCWVCHKDKLPGLFVKYKDRLSDAPKISHLLENWDILDTTVDFIDIAGCLIPGEKHLHATGGHYILQPTKHNTFHVKSFFINSSKCINK